ncbi:MAG: DedA family protein [Prevotellaceae bacterium]|nr:DedA family protein [Candidatus Colivivens equi]MCQ2078001.1 DedA family protein [Bacteroidaceae bacterium]
MTEFFLTYGYWGMGMAAFVAGTFLPFSSEAVMATLLATTAMSPFLTVTSATIGNVAGSMVNYFIGRFATKETVARWFKVRQDRMDKAQKYVSKYGAWMGFFTFVPILGTAIALALGALRANPWTTFLSTLIGKTLRYVFIAYTVSMF